MLTKVHISYALAVISIIAIVWLGFTSFQNTLSLHKDFQFLASIAPSITPTSTVAKTSLKKSNVASKVVAPVVLGDSSESLPSVFQTEPVAPVSETHTNNLSTGQAGLPASIDSIPIDPIPLPPAAPACSFATKQFPNYRGIIMNEVAWMGTGASATNEWLELFNPTNQTVNIAGWHLFDKAEQIAITFPAGTLLTPKEFFMLERGEDALPGIRAGLIYIGALSNNDEALRLFDKDCFLVDEVFANPEWPAGNAEEKRSMERGNNLAWHTYLGSANAGILGTPGKENSLPPVVVSPAAQAETTELMSPLPSPSSSSEIVIPPPESAVSSSVTIETPIPSSSVSVPISLSHIVISEVQITGGAGHTTDDFIELYNPLSVQFNLKGYRLVKRAKTSTTDTSLKSWTDDAFIPAGGYYLWANSNYVTIVTIPDMKTFGSIADDNAVALRQGSEDTGLIIDALGFGAAANGIFEGSAFPTNP